MQCRSRQQDNKVSTLANKEMPIRHAYTCPSYGSAGKRSREIFDKDEEIMCSVVAKYKHMEKKDLVNVSGGIPTTGHHQVCNT